MRRINLALFLVSIGVSAAIGQQRPTDPASIVPRLDLSLGYNYMNANAPPGQSGYFGLNGGYISGNVHLSNWLGIAGEFTGGHANNISLLGQNLTLTTYLVGPKVSVSGRRWVPFAQILFGGAHGGDSYFPSGTSFSSSASSFALSSGGGVDVNLTKRFAVRVVDVDYLKTSLPNGITNAQNHFTIATGIVIKFGVHDPSSYGVSKMAPRPSEIMFTCGTNVSNIDQGQILEITGHTLTEPDHLEVTYTWASNGGTVDGSGRRVTINTTGIAAGDYRVTGHVILVSSPSTKAECVANFRVNAHSASSAAGTSSAADQAAERERKNTVFHENVRDALFNYDSAEIRPDAHDAILHAAEYLRDNPSIRVLVGGYADERGSAEYNLGLGEERATAARNALIDAGVDPERIQIISYGKEAQVCTAENETCWQQNRRAAFSLHP